MLVTPGATGAQRNHDLGDCGSNRRPAAAASHESEPSPEQTPTIHEDLMKAAQDNTQRAGEPDRLLLKAGRLAGRAASSGPAALAKGPARLLFRRAAP